MSAIDSKKVLLKIGDGGSPSESFTMIGGMVAADIRISRSPEVAVNAASGSWQQLVSDGGIRQAGITVRGVFEDSAAEEVLRSVAFSGAVRSMEFHFGNGDRISGKFIVTDYQRSGKIGEATDFQVTLSSAGSLTFVAG